MTPLLTSSRQAGRSDLGTWIPDRNHRCTRSDRGSCARLPNSRPSLRGGARVGWIPVLRPGARSRPVQAREPAADPQGLGIVFEDRDAAELEEGDAARERLRNALIRTTRSRAIPATF